jgi:RNA polymerase sigma-70 factor (ECF subfamily)
MIAFARRSNRAVSLRRRMSVVRTTKSVAIAQTTMSDEQMAETIVREHTGRMLAVAKRYLRCADEAADAVQDAFVSALASLDRFRGEASVGTWLHRIVVNVCLMRLRARRSQPTTSLDALLPSFDQFGRHAESISPCQAGSDGLELHETRTLVRACIDKLPADHRAILLLRDIDGFDTTDTAELLGISRVAVKNRLHRARQALRTLLAPHFVTDAAPAKTARRGNRA